MGAASSSEHGSSSAQQEEESLAASTGALPALRAAFSRLACPDPPTIPFSSLQDAFSLGVEPNLASESSSTPQHFTQLLLGVGPSVADLLFVPSKEGLNWLDLLRGYNKCCARMPASSSLNILYRLYSKASERAGVKTALDFDPFEEDGKVGGSLSSSDLLMILWMCYVMEWCRRGCKGGLVLPDVRHLVLSAFLSCGEVGDDKGIWGCDVLGMEKCVSVQKVNMWVLATVPGLVHCFSRFVQGKIQACGTSEIKAASICGSDSSSDAHDACLLTCGRAWAVFLTLRNSLGDDLSGACFLGKGTETLDNLLYRSSIHGKGLSRFWSNIEGYDGPLLILLSANSTKEHGDGSNNGRWVIGILTEQGFENMDTFHGSSGYLYAISPVFRVLSPSGKDKNFMYCHLHPAIRVYEPHPKPVGLAFGGTIGNERIFIDEDFAEVTIRHHAVDKTYRPGSLIPNQGFLPVEASVLEVEVWGFGGKAAKEHQNAYKKREMLFSEQRRKVDLKTFASWEDSPEKMMMDMVSDPNKVRQEDR